MRPYLSCLSLLTLAIACGTSRADAQLFDRLSNPKITVALNHPPGLGLKVSRIALARPVGDKADQVADALASDLLSGGMEVLDRQHLQATLAEHQLNASGYLNPQTTARLGQLLGSTALLFVNVQRAATEKVLLREPVQDRNKQPHMRYHSQTKAYLKVSIVTVDLTTGRTMQARVFESNPVQTNTTVDNCCAVYPSEFDVLDAGINEVVAQAHRLFLPWQEQQQLYFFDDKECGLKTAFSLLKGGDIDGARKESIVNVETCKTEPKMNEKRVAHSLYNAGMSAFLQADYDVAIDFLMQAQRVKDIGITVEALTQVRRARDLAAESQRVGERTAQAERDALAAAAPPPAPAPPPPEVKSVAPRPAKASARTQPPASTAKRAPSSPVIPASPPKEAGAPPRGTVSERLKSLNALFKQGLVSQAEYDKKKAEILKDM
ncbi:MAG: CsgG/HfaB family protein [Dokdonella sp.]